MKLAKIVLLLAITAIATLGRPTLAPEAAPSTATIANNGEATNMALQSPGSDVGTPPANNDFETDSYLSVAPGNHDFETGSIAPWSALSGSFSVQSGGNPGQYVKATASAGPRPTPLPCPTTPRRSAGTTSRPARAPATS